jgi:restriction system protein
MNIKRHDSFFDPVVEALKLLGGSGTNQEILEKVIQVTKLSDEQIEVLHVDGPRTKVDYQIGWAKTYLKKFGILENSKKGVWSLTERGMREPLPDKQEINTFYRNHTNSTATQSNSGDENQLPTESSNEDSEEWIEKLTEVMLSITPEGFERLCQRIFREKGFIKVEVTGRSGDGGIDGTGILKIGLVTFKVIFQCKRYKGSVGSSEIRNFRGAMSGRTDKGIFLTTGRFTKEAKKEAERDGAESIDLIDGAELCSLLKELKLGVETKEIVVVDDDWFEDFK